jgi:PIN like domain
MPRRSASGAEPPLQFFLDRGLGSIIVPTALRGAGWILETMDERYGKDVSQRISDIQWVEEATNNGDVLLCKDLRIAKNPLEAAVVDRVSARVFGLKDRNVSGATMVAHLLGNQVAIFQMARRAAGPYVVSVDDSAAPRPLRRLVLNRP